MSFRETLLYRGLEDHVRALMREETVALMNEAHTSGELLELHMGMEEVVQALSELELALHAAQGRLRKGIRDYSKTG